MGPTQVSEAPASKPKSITTCVAFERQTERLLESVPSPPPAVNKLVQDVIRDQVAAHPYAPAICTATGYLTYKELADASSRLAVQIAERGIGHNSIVPILCGKSAFTIVAMLAVLKAGGAFAALDVSHPDERLSEIIEDTKATILLSSPEQARRFSWISSLSVVELSGDMTLATDPTLETSETRLDASPEDIMYTIFTSGSTGRPKGVMIEHRSWLTSALAYGSEQGLNRNSRVLQFASYAFDMSLMEIFTTLIFGGCVCVPADADRFGMIEDFVNKMGVNTLMLTPSYAKLLDPAKMPSVQTLVTGGEAVPSDLLKIWNSHVDVYIAYGPTEASIQAAGTKIPVGSPEVPSGLIGHATGCNLWIVREDNQNELVVEGEIGELLIEGHTLARGYLGDKAKTEAAFVTVSLGSGSRRMFKTGDLVRQLPGGSIVFVSRKDTQVKIQGQRFELTEIDARLGAILPHGSKVCVDNVESGHRAVLVAFVSNSMTMFAGDRTDVCWDRVEATLEQVPNIRANLGKVLPNAMIPKLYVPVTFIPLTTSHKTDRKALRELVERMSFDELERFRKSDASQKKAATSSPRELALRGLWALLLDRKPETIGPDDDFIQLGGDSVTSIRLVSAARGRGITLTSAMVLSNPVLKAMAREALFCDHHHSQGHDQHIQPFALVEGRAEELRAMAAAICRLPVDEIEDVFPMTISQMRWFGKTLVKPNAYVDQYHFKLPADIDCERLLSAITKTVQAADLLKARALATTDRKLFLAITRPHEVQVSEVTDGLETYLKQDLQSPMGLGAPLSRYALVRMPDSALTFVWTIHHALYDGYSLPMLLQTIQDFYHGLQPKPFTPFNRYVKGPSTQELSEGEEFWKRYLSGSFWTKFPELTSPDKNSASSMNRIIRDIALIPMDTLPVAFVGTKSVTTANLVRIAYAAALSLHSFDHPSAVLFLESLGGRNSTIVGIDRVAGPTLLTIPTRVELTSSVSCAQLCSESQVSLVERMRFENFPLPRLLPLAPALELRNVLMIEDQAFLINGTGEGLFDRGHEELKLDETEGLPMIFRCTIDRGALKVDIRYDEAAACCEDMEAFFGTFERVMKEIYHGDAGRPFADVLSLASS